MNYVKVKLGRILKETGLTQKWLAKESGLHESVISGIVRNYKNSINKKHLAAIMKALEITDFNEILEIVDD